MQAKTIACKTNVGLYTIKILFHIYNSSFSSITK